MKHRFIFSLLSVFIFSLFFSNSAFAVENTPAKPAPKTFQAVPIANVNLQNARILSQEGNTFNVYFEIANGKIIQSDVRYGVRLVSTTKAGQFLADEKVFEDSLTLPENSLTKKDLVYTAPGTLNGTYTLVFFSSNSSGLPFGALSLGEVKVTSSVKGIQIVPESCYLTVEGEKIAKQYGLLQTVDISKDEALKLTCKTINNYNEVKSLPPIFETRYQSAYGEIAPVTGGDTAPIAFKAVKDGSFTILLPKGTTPRVYNLSLKLGTGESATNTITAKYVIRGLSATITNATLDKDYYNRRDDATLSVLWNTPSPFGKYLRGSIVGLTEEGLALTLTGNITDGEGKTCADSFEQVLAPDDKSKKVDFTFKMKSKCIDPHISLTIKDKNGNTLDQKEFDVESTSMPESKPLNPKLAVVLVIVLLVIVGGAIYMKKKKGINNDINS